MKKRKVIVIISIIVLIVIALIIAIISINNKRDDVSKLKPIFEKINSSSAYKFTAEKNDEEKTIMAKKGNQTLIDQYFSGVHRTTLVKDDTTCYILHDREEYYIYENSNIEQTILEDAIADLLQRTYTTGTEKVFGKKYDYEEYNGSSAFLLTNLRDVNEENIKTKLYFDKNDNLKYIKTIYGENEEELLNIDIQYEVEDSMFEIPSNYAEGN